MAAAGTTLGVFADFITIQNAMKLGIPWIIPYEVTVSSLTIFFMLLMLVLITRRMLLPNVVMIGTFILFVLWLTGLIETGIQLFGSAADVNSNCNRYIEDHKVTGQSIDTLAWLQQDAICSDWLAAFSFEVIGTIFLLWMMIMASQVSRDEGDQP
ncbi:MAG: hypothetical protein M1819_000544 [Sarea resinae]|nr:MAG: hypothetical protein M1819_000544 [Sarea resinae]